MNGSLVTLGVQFPHLFCGTWTNLVIQSAGISFMPHAGPSLCHLPIKAGGRHVAGHTVGTSRRLSCVSFQCPGLQSR